MAKKDVDVIETKAAPAPLQPDNSERGVGFTDAGGRERRRRRGENRV
jgi:hypothetical protein